MNKTKKPMGGFRLIGAYELLAVYFAFNRGLIRWYDLRVWFACQEAVARRCCAKKDIPRRYLVDEIRVLVGRSAESKVRAALKRLERGGLLRWSEEGIAFAKSPEEMRGDDFSGFSMMLGDFGQRDRRVPVPRRTIRFIARGARKVLTATMLGQVLRCCHLRNGEYKAEGSCAASWIARLFDLDERNVKMARKNLVSIGWLLPAQSDAWHRQKYGARAIISLDWSDAARKVSSPVVVGDNVIDSRKTNRSPQNADLKGKRSPLLILKENSFGSKNQKPALAADRLAGVYTETKNKNKPPTIRHVEPEDLRDLNRTLGLFEEAVGQGLVSRCEADRLKFVAAAERANKVATKNACGFFATVVRRGLWKHVTAEEEDSARMRLKSALADGMLSGPMRSREKVRHRQVKASGTKLRITGANEEAFTERVRIRELIAHSLASVPCP